MHSVNRHVQRSERTRTELVAAARALFSERGYAAVSTEAVVRAAGVTRGALYHQFTGGKEELFRAVIEQVEAELVEGLAAVMRAGEPLAGLHAGLAAALDAALVPEVVRLTLLDAPAVLGWSAWRELGDRYGLGLLRARLEAAMDAGALGRAPVDPLAQLLLAALEEAMLYVARADDRRRARAEAGAALARIVDGLRPASSAP